MKKNKFIIWGVGEGAKNLIKYIPLTDVLYFADNNKELYGQYYMGKKIVPLQDVLKLKENYLIIISSSKYEKEIKEQLLQNGLTNFINATQYKINQLFAVIHPKNKRIILLNTHDNINIGDHTITIAEHYFFRKYMSDYEVIEIPLTLCKEELEYIYQFVKNDDLLIITGGGFLGSLWLEGGENNVRKIIQLFINNKIVIFPQTLYYEKTIEGENQKKLSQTIYNKHNNLTICFRDKLSYQLGINTFNDNIQKLYVPDIVTLLDRSDEIYSRKGILMCIREDKERILSQNFVEKIKVKLLKKNYIITQMSMLLEKNILLKDRMDVINIKLRQIQTSELVITDRLHCMLLCVISGTPCLAFDNQSGKVHGAYYWICENSYICLADENEHIWKNIEHLLNMPYMAYSKEKVEKEFNKLAKFLKAKDV